MDKPNILVIMTDQHDPGVSSAYGHRLVRTPNMQRLADEGGVFEHAYCNAPLCTPSRAAFMTGTHPFRTRVWDNMVSMASDLPTWAHRLNAAGYETCLSGKMHFIGPDQLHGFRRRLIEDIHGMGPNWGRVPNWNNNDPADRKGRQRLIDEPGAGEHLHMSYDNEVVEKTRAYLREPARHESPWALCVSFFTPHFPFIARPEYFHHYYPDRVDMPEIPDGHLASQHAVSKRLRDFYGCAEIPEENVRRVRAAYYGLVEFVDDQIGAVLDALEGNGLAQNTVVVYVSDHGELNGEHGLWFKCSFYEQSVRVPLIVRWPDKVPPGTRYKRITSLIDVTATLLDISGADNEGVDGTSLAPLLIGAEADGGGVALAEYEAQVARSPWRMVRRDRYKLNYYHGEGCELFDLEADPGEFHDLAANPAHGEVVRELREVALTDWDPEAIGASVLDSQFQRRLVGRGMGGPWSPPWRMGRY